MQRKNLLAAASAAALALGFATQAAAASDVSLVYSGSPTSPSDISTGSDLQSPAPSSPQGSYEEGTESKFASPFTNNVSQGTAAMDLVLPGPIGSDNYALTVTLTNATFGSGGMPSTDVTSAVTGSCTAFTVTSTTPPSPPSKNAKFNIGVAGTCPGPIHLEIPVNVNNGTGGPVSVSADLTLDDGTPIGITGMATYSNAITFVTAMHASATSELVDNGHNTYASLLDYRAFGPDTKLGDAKVGLNTNVHYDLVNDLFTDAMLTNTRLTITGAFSTVNPKGTGASASFPQDWGDGTLGQCIVNVPKTLCVADSTAAGDWQYDPGLEQVPGFPVIQPSPYSATVGANLANSIYAASTSGSFDAAHAFMVTGPINPLGRQGAFVFVPWTASAAQATATGSDNTIRIANDGQTATGPVLLEVLASTCHPASAVAPCNGVDPVGASPLQLTGSIAPGGEFVINDAEAALISSQIGDYGRADLKITVVADPRTVTVKKEITKNGNISDQALGSMADGLAEGILIGEENITPARFQDNNGPVTVGPNANNPTSPTPTGADNTATSGNPLNPQNLSGIPIITLVPDSVPGTVGGSPVVTDPPPPAQFPPG